MVLYVVLVDHCHLIFANTQYFMHKQKENFLEDGMICCHFYFDQSLVHLIFPLLLSLHFRIKLKKTEKFLHHTHHPGIIYYYITYVIRYRIKQKKLTFSMHQCVNFVYTSLYGFVCPRGYFLIHSLLSACTGQFVS